MALVFVGTWIAYRCEENASGWFALNWANDRARLDARYGRILRAPGTKFVAVSGECGGQYYRMLLYEYGPRVAGEMLLNDPEGGRVKAEKLREFVRQAPYVLILYPQESTPREYPELWESPPGKLEPISLFEVTPEGKLRPVR